MKLIALFLFTSVAAVAHSEATQKLECWYSEPACRHVLTVFGSSDVIASGLRSSDFAVEGDVSLVSSRSNNSIMIVSLRDKQSGQTRSIQYTVEDRTSLAGGIEKFLASNGISYSLTCTGSRVEAGGDIASRPSKCE